MAKTKDKNEWGSNLSFLLAMIGSAVGLGHWDLYWRQQGVPLDLEIFGDILMFCTVMVVEHFSYHILLQF